MSDDKPEAMRVAAEKRQQGGFDIWVGRCPRCGYTFGLTDPGRIICNCGTLLQFVEATEQR